ncbi:hypothetical protein [Myxosarcina sp. GI1(2024)]
MSNLIFQAIGKLSSLLKKIKITTLVTAVLVGLIFLTSNPSYAAQRQDTSNIDRDVLESSNPERPTNIKEWQQEARRTEDEPLERAQEIGKETVEAVKDMGKMYSDTAERTAPDNLSDS